MGGEKYLSDNRNSESMIYVYDVFTDLYGDDKLRLTPELMYMYCLLYRSRKFDLTTEITVDMIHYQSRIKYYPSLVSKNRKVIKLYLIELRNRGIISFELLEDKLMSRKGNNTPFRIEFVRFIENSGYTQLSYDDFDNSLDIHKLYIRLAVERYNNVDTLGKGKGRWISEKEFADLLGVSKTTFRKYANEMIDQGMLYKQSGEYAYPQHQDKNTYRTIPFDNPQSNLKDKKYPNGTVLDTVIGELQVWEIKEQFDNSNWGKKNNGLWLEIDHSDYEIFRVCEDYGISMKKVYKTKEVIEKLRYNPEYNSKFDEYEKNYNLQKQG